MRRVPIIKGDTAFIPLTQGYEAVIDTADLPLVHDRLWRVDRRSRHDCIYAVYTHNCFVKPAIIPMHRMITAAPQGIFVDHIDGNGLNNRRSNLRLVSKAENAWNTRVYRTNTSGFKGVCFNKARQKWQAGIKHFGKNIYLGLFETPEEAHSAYCQAAEKLFGEYRRTA